ncbi:hypothetical protein ACFX15_002531 [Malus domestica]
MKSKGESESIIVSIYIDGIIYTGSSTELLEEFKCDMMRIYDMIDLGLLYHFLKMRILQSESGIFINQRKYTVSLLQKFGLKDCKSVSTPLLVNDKLKKDDESEKTYENVYRQLVGSLLYLTATKPYIMFVASLLARFMHGPTKKHLGAAKKVLRYIQDTLDYGIEYEKGEESILICHCDSDWSGDETDMKSTSGYAFSFGSGVFS